MNYYEFLNKKLASTGLMEGYTFSSSSNATNPFAQDGKAGSRTSVQFPYGSIFTSASKEDLNKVDYNKILGNLDGQNDVEISPLEYILKEFFALGNVKKDADADGDGEVSVEEAQIYVNKLAAKDGNGEDLTLQDFEAIIRENGIDLEAISNFLQQAVEADGAGAGSDIKTAEVSEQVVGQSVSDNSNDTVATGNKRNRINLKLVTPQSSRVSASNMLSVKSVDMMTLPELNVEKTRRERVVTEKRNALISAKMGDDKPLQEAKLNVVSAKRKYDKALKIDKFASKYSAKVKNNEVQIKANEQAINKNEAAITSKQGEITDCEANISFSESVISGLEDTLAEIPETEDNQKINNQRALVEKQITAKRRELEQQKARLEKLKQELAELNGTKEQLQANKNGLQTEKTGIEKTIKIVASVATKEALKRFQESVQSYSRTKERVIKIAEQELKAAEAAVQEINQKIKAKEIENAKKSDTADLNDTVSEALEIAQAQDSSTSNIPNSKKSKGEKYSYTDLLYGVNKGASNSANPVSEQVIKQQAISAGCYSPKGSGYKPQKGDLAMLTSTSVSGNVGIVTEVYLDGSFDIAEGLAGNSVATRHYKSTKEATCCNGFVQMTKWKQSGVV